MGTGSYFQTSDSQQVLQKVTTCQADSQVSTKASLVEYLCNCLYFCKQSFS